MTPHQLKKLDGELTAFLREMLEGQGRPERRAALGHYITGLLLDGERKSVQPMAGRLAKDPGEAEAIRQRLQDCVAASRWSEDGLWKRLALKLDRELPGLEALVVDDTGFAKKGTHSVGVGRQYSGTLGRTDNCQVATSLHVAGSRGSGCIGFRLYLPDAWTNDRERCRNAGVPDNRTFKTKWELALELLDEALATGVQRRTVLADAGYGEIPQFRDELTCRGLTYVVGVPGNHLIWPPGTDPQQPPRRAGKVGRPQTRWRDGHAQPIQIAKLVEGIARPRYRTVTWRDGTRGTMESKFLAYRVRPAEGHTKGRPPAEPQWLLCEWPSSDKVPMFFFSTLPPSTSLRELVRLTKLRWRVERDYQELKGEVGLDHFEGRSWRGFHRHAALCAVAHAFLALRRALSPPVPRPVDPAGGTTSLAADSPAAHRLVPALRPSRPPPVASTSEVALMTPLRAQT